MRKKNKKKQSPLLAILTFTTSSNPAYFTTTIKQL